MKQWKWTKNKVGVRRSALTPLSEESSNRITGESYDK